MGPGRKYKISSTVMEDSEGVQFLQWCLPKLHLRWAGFRKVRRQVYKRINRRVKELGLSEFVDYRTYLAVHPEEWSVLETLCWISISRFYRDLGVFQYLERKVLPELARKAVAGAEAELRCWSIGCAAGEEPYTLAILWTLRLMSQFPSLTMRILATDIDPQAIVRAERGCYPASSVKDLPAELLTEAFVTSADGFCVKEEYREPVTFQLHDILESAPEGSFHLILCRYLIFTYFEEELQRATLEKILASLATGGALVIGNTESLPEGVPGLDVWDQKMGVYRKSG